MRAGEHVTPQVRLVRSIGAGGMGAVWLADHLTLKTQVAVKFILAGRETDTEARERFSREAEAAAQVKSPHVAQIFDHGVTEDGIPFIVMELLEGEDCSRYLATHGRLGLHEAAAIVTQVCRALARAHAKGLIHRDVKPANIFLCDVGTPERFVKLLDFGVAKVVGDTSSGTKSGSLTGTPVYMAPEQLLGARDLDHRADLWSVGVLAYELITGRRPCAEETAAAIALRVHTRGMPRGSEGMGDLSSATAEAIDQFFLKAWAIQAKDRYDNALTLAEDFERLVRVIQEQAGVESTKRFLLPLDRLAEDPTKMELTVREPSVNSDRTLASGRLEVAPHPMPTLEGPRSSQPRSQGAPRSGEGQIAPLRIEVAQHATVPGRPGHDAPHTETPISRGVRESNGAISAPEPPSRARWAGAAALVLIVAVGIAFTLGRRGSDPAATSPGTTSASTTSALASNTAKHVEAEPPASASAPSVAASAAVAPSALPSSAVTVKPLSSAKTAASATAKKPPPSATGTKKLEDIE